uniref:Endonuclease/exonuclease/phosphatase domain-containing protein n=1 Tax=Trichogramma kaykai TaxID=54128 RepID=A0ABD2WSB4_9HYME
MTEQRIRVLQLNLNHCESAQDLVLQTVRELKVDVAILSDPHRPLTPPNTWISDADNQAAIWVRSGVPVQRCSSGQSHFYTWAQIAGIYIFSIYAPPRLSHEEFIGLLNNIVDEARGKTPVLVAGDFNAWATEWGSRETKPRGRELLNSLATLDVLLLNTGSEPTFVGEQGESVIDLTFASVSLYNRVGSWRVSDVYTSSDHKAIVYEILLEENHGVGRAPAGNRRWSARTLDSDSFAEIVSEMEIRSGSAENMVDELMSTIVRACDASMSGGRDRRRREPVYWWNDDIAECRRDCIRARRYAQRARGRPDEVIRREEFADARRRLRNAIKASKRLCWRQLCDEADRDVWGKPYRTVMSRLKAPRTPPPTAPDLVRRAVSTLFPSVVPRLIGAPPVLEEYLIPEVGVEELRWAYRRVRIGAAPGPDGIPNTALKAAVEACFDSFRRVFTACLREGCFPAHWKRQRLVLMLKPGKPAAEPSSYRPLCMLDTVGKILERIMVGRLEAHTEGPAGLADSQFGFRKRRSTVDAIQTVLSTA